MATDNDEALSEVEIAKRRDEVVKRMLATPPQPKKPPKPAKYAAKGGACP
jgi:hypothetical protein